MSGVRALMVVVMAVLGLAAAYVGSERLRSDARTGWEVEAAGTAGTLTATLLNWLEESYAPLSGLAALTENSQHVSESEFLSAFDGLEARATAFFLEGAALIEPFPADSEDGWRIKYSTDPDGILSPDAPLSAQPELLKTVRVAKLRFGEMILGQPIPGLDGKARVSPVALGTFSADGPLVIVGLVDYGALVRGLFELHVPAGAGISIAGRFPELQGQGASRPVHRQGVADPLYASITRTVSASAELAITWAFDARFSDGPAEELANLALLSGIIGVAVITLFFAVLLQRNRTITLRVEEATRELSEKEALFRSVFETRAAGMALLDMDGRYVQANERFCEIVGYSEDELKTMTWRDITHADDIERVEKLDRQVEVGEYSDFYTERRLIRKDGAVIWTNLASAQLRDENGVSQNIFSFVQDITELKEAERAIRENEKNLRDLLDSSPVGIGVIDQETNERLFVNQHLVEMMGAETAEQLTSADLKESYVNVEDVDEIRRVVGDGGTVRNMEVQRRRIDGSTFWTLQSSQRLGSFQGREARVVWMVDVTELKDAQAEMATQKAIIDTALANMSQGISMFDENLNLVALNERFIELLDFPEEFGEIGTPLATFFRHNAERGEYGEGDIEALVQERIDLAEKFEAHQFQRVLSDGKTIEVKGQPVPSGGFVTTYTDITEIIEAQRGAKLLQEALDTFSDMVVLYDKDEKVIFTNDRYHEIYPNSPPKEEIKNYTMEDLMRRSLESGLIKHPLAQEDPEAWLAQALAARRNEDGGSGETTHESGRTYFYRYGWTTEGGMILVQIDITERKQAAKDLADK